MLPMRAVLLDISPPLYKESGRPYVTDVGSMVAETQANLISSPSDWQPSSPLTGPTQGGSKQRLWLQVRYFFYFIAE